ncbi:MAG: ABC transporter permease [Candidatus Hadarchaeum sp.]|uniref:ABC transporter permease n=1 Tax=Candidatus Hadarchaeum sp. TaxID=2883567 RepID=UPI0031722279
MNNKTLKRFLKHKGGLAGGVLVFVFIVCAIFAPQLAPCSPDRIDLKNVASPPSLNHLLGTDKLGRDILSRILYGTRISIYLSVLSTAGALLFGVILGTVAGFYGGKVDFVVTLVADVLISFPSFLLALAVVSFLGPGLSNLLIALSFSSCPRFFRIMRAAVLQTKQAEYVSAGCAIGANTLRIITVHIIPNSFSPVLVQSTLNLASSILTASGLGFLGLGVQPPTPEWGLMVSEGRALLRTAPHVSLVPACVIALYVLAFNLLGDALRDALDVKL